MESKTLTQQTIKQPLDTSTMLSASLPPASRGSNAEFLPRSDSMSRQGSTTTRATTPTKAESRYLKVENGLLSIARDYIG
ncbi:MAG: hypothetical protein FJZ86_13735 [Chloroflexi bacterium]|nr:hypothetical protein [Chloroflexota bacterium]